MHPDTDLEALLKRYATGRYRPATFLERGAALPLTTPQLLGARIRPAERKGAELVLPNPAGAEGVYVLPWAAMPDFCAPSLHDRALWSRVTALPVLSPPAVREAARQVAAEGYAGRAAARAAGAASAARRDGRALAAYGLLLLLLRQGEPPGHPLPPPERDLPANVQLRVRGVLKRHAATLPPARALEALEEIAGAFEGCGLGPDPRAAPLPRLVEGLAALAREVAAWSAAQPEPELRACADLVAAATDLTLRCARAALAEAHALPRDLLGLLARWHAGAEEPRSVAARPDWTLDGWDLVLGLWRSAEDRAAALADMALLVPVIPSEARDWLGFDAAGDMEAHRRGLRTWRRTVAARQDWITGRMSELAQRGEALREACA